MIPTVTIIPGNTVDSSISNPSDIETLDTFLADINEVYVISIDGFYIRVARGIPVGNDTSSASNVTGSIPSGTIEPGNEIGTSPFTPGA